MTEDRSEHWLWRLDAPAWLRAAEAELDAGAANLAQRRTAVTHARRAAGMALNAVLAAAPPDADELRWGRSYIDHLRALADPARPIDPLPAAARPLAAALLQIPVLATATTLIPLGRTAHHPAQQSLDLARELLAHCAHAVTAPPPRPAN